MCGTIKCCTPEYTCGNTLLSRRLSPAGLMATTGARSRELSFLQTCPLWPPRHRARRAAIYDALRVSGRAHIDGAGGIWGAGIEPTLFNRGCADVRCVGLGRIG